MAENLSDQEEDYEALQILQSETGSDPEYYDEEEEEEVDRGVSVSQNSVTVVSAREEERDKRRREEVTGNICCSSVGYDESSQGGSQWNRSEIDGLFCPICMDAWTSDGDHHICCLRCGHLFGLSCISKWIVQCGRSAKCPQCNRKCTLKDVRKLFAPRIAVVDEESQKRIRFLEAKCDSLEKKDAAWHKQESDAKRRETALQLELDMLEKKTNHLQHLLEKLQSRPVGALSAGRGYQGQSLSGNNKNANIYCLGSSSSFVLKTELPVEGARLFDIDASASMLLLARKLPGMGGSHVLTKMSLISPHESEDIFLPSSTKFIKDMHISPLHEDLVLYACLGKKLSVLSMESNNMVLSYDLPAPAWSCSWDLSSSHYLCAGLQNGSLLLFDMRQTIRPVECRLGLTTNPIHRIYSLLQDEPTLGSGAQTFLSASSIGICQWNFRNAEERPSLISETANQGICISLAYCGITRDIVASYRPKVEIPSEMAASQPPLTPFASGHGTSGFHLHLKRLGSNYHTLGTEFATVSDIRLPKSAIINREDEKSLFALGEVTHQLVLQELPSFAVAQRFKPHNHYVCDVKYTNTDGQDLLGCLSEDTVQLFSTKLS